MRFFYVVVAQKNSCGSLATWKFCYKFEIFEICTLYSRSLSFTTDIHHSCHPGLDRANTSIVAST